MPNLSRRPPDWALQLRASGAHLKLGGVQPDKFPLQDLRKLSEDLLQTSSASTFSLGRRGIDKCSTEGDELFLQELDPIKNEFLVHETGVIACLHVLTFQVARGLLQSLQPETNEFFDKRLPVYLQCLILANKTRDGLLQKPVADAASELLTIVTSKKKDGFPSIWRVLRPMGDEAYDYFLPESLVHNILRRSRFKGNLAAELELLRTSQNWKEAWRLVAGLQKILGNDRAVNVVRDIFPQYPMWSVWRPSRTRITLWTHEVLDPFRQRLVPLFELEGPDSTGQQRGSLKQSTPGIFQHADVHTIERLLDVFDRAVHIGPESIELVISLCMERGSLNEINIQRLDTALEIGHDSSSAKLSHYLKIIRNHQTSPHDRMIAITSALPTIGRSSKLQDIYGIQLNIQELGPEAFSGSQKQFCMLLLDNRPCERFGLNLRAFGNELLRATWLFQYWWPSYIDMLAQIPSETDIRTYIRGLQAHHGDAKIPYRNYLAEKLGGMVISGPLGQVNAPRLTPEDPIWYDDLDRDRDNLRSRLRAVPKIDKSLATTCLKQSRNEHDSVVRELVNIVCDNTDQICVNLASFLGTRTLKARVADCWKSLLLHLMRQRPQGLLDRRAEELSYQSWLNWIHNMDRLFGDRHLDPHGGLGFTKAKISRLTAQRMEIQRSLSTSTTSTTGTGRVSSMASGI
jgi:hypothetical protein